MKTMADVEAFLLEAGFKRTIPEVAAGLEEKLHTPVRACFSRRPVSCPKCGAEEVFLMGREWVCKCNEVHLASYERVMLLERHPVSRWPSETSEPSASSATSRSCIVDPPCGDCARCNARAALEGTEVE